MTTPGRVLRVRSVAVVSVCALAAAVPMASAASASASITVAADGSGNYTTVQAAIDSVAANNSVPVTITIRPGTYRGVVTIPANKPYLTLVGAGSSAAQV